MALLLAPPQNFASALEVGGRVRIHASLDGNALYALLALPVRGLIWQVRERGSRASAKAVRKAADALLLRNLFRRRSTGGRIAVDFIELHCPCYWHYDVLAALKILAEGGFLRDRPVRRSDRAGPLEAAAPSALPSTWCRGAARFGRPHRAPTGASRRVPIVESPCAALRHRSPL